MFPIEVFRATLTKLVTILTEQGVRFHLVGGITSISYGDPRMTQDVDVVVDNAALGKRQSQFLAALQESDFIHSADEIREAINTRGMFQLMDREESLKLDVYAREMIPGELDRSQPTEVFEGEFLPMASRADTILAKLVWISKGSGKSRRDLRYLHRGADAQERAFVDELAADLQLTDLLTEVLAEPEEID